MLMLVEFRTSGGSDIAIDMNKIETIKPCPDNADHTMIFMGGSGGGHWLVIGRYRDVLKRLHVLKKPPTI